jgi:hypothetical protein
MSELLYLDEKSYENVTYSYKSIKPSCVNDKEIIYEFPDGNYLIDSLNLVIKFDDTIISRNNLTFDDFIEKIIVPYDYAQPLHDHDSVIPIKFISAYNDICKLNKDNLCFHIPLIKLFSFRINFGDFGKINNKTVIKMLRQQKYTIDPLDIFQEVKNVNLENMPSELMDSLTTYSASKISFELFYRETKFFDSIGKLVPPNSKEKIDVFESNVKFDNTDICKIKISDPKFLYDYRHMLIVMDNNINEDDTTTDNFINKILLKTTFSPNLPIERMQFRELFTDGVFEITKEHADIFGINIQVDKTHYLVDISEFMTVYVSSLTKNPAMFDEVYHVSRMTCLVKKYEQTVDLYKKSLNDFLGPKWSVANSDMALELTLTLKNKYNGMVNVYLF